jgi:hypothetical protein
MVTSSAFPLQHDSSAALARRQPAMLEGSFVGEAADWQQQLTLERCLSAHDRVLKDLRGLRNMLKTLLSDEVE